MRFLKTKKLVFLPVAALLLCSLFTSSCTKSVKVSFTTRDIIRFLIRDNPGIFSNSFLDTASAAVTGSGISFSRTYAIRTIDTAIVLNDLDTITTNPLNVVPKSPRDAGADVIDTLVGNLRLTDSNGTAVSPFRLPVIKFGYFQKLQSDAFANRGWYVMGAAQTFVGAAGLLDSVRIRAFQSNKNVLILRRTRTNDPENDPALEKVRTNPLQMKPLDSAEVRVWGPSVDDAVFCHVVDSAAIRRLELRPDSNGVFTAKVTLAQGPLYRFQRIVIDALPRNTLLGGLPVRNEIWGIIYQVYP